MARRLEASNLIGKKAEVLKSTDKMYVGFVGKIIFESEKTIVLENLQGERKTFLKSALILIKVDSEEIVCTELFARTFERIRGNA